jgi:hypothetical protein
VAEEGDVLGIPDVRVDLSAVREWAHRAVRGEEPWMPPPHFSTHELLPGWGEEGNRLDAVRRFDRCQRQLRQGLSPHSRAVPQGCRTP